MLHACGVEEDRTQMFTDLNKNAKRHIKTGGTYGQPMHIYNGIGQGDSLALMSAIVYVAIQHRYILGQHPNIRMSSVIDDRNLRGTVEDLSSAITDVIVFDEMAGHFTNPKNIAATAIAATDSEKLRNSTSEPSR